jgi:RNA polymerase sigma-70 factor (ECF subfamily)
VNESSPAAGGPRDPDPLAERLRAGDPDACREMIDRHATRMLRILLHVRGVRDDAEDVLQETWIAACRAAREFRGDASLRTWLDRIALNAAAMADRRGAALSRGAGVPPVRIAATAPDGEPGLVEVRAPDDAERAVIWRETLAELSAAVGGLPRGLRDVVVLRDIQGASTRETASELGISEDAVKQRLHRARAHLRASLEHLADEAA